MERICDYCAGEHCHLQDNMDNDEICIFNLIIFENEIKTLFFNMAEKRIFLIEKNKGLREIDFKEAIREIDIIPTQKPEWKRLQILKLAKDLGFFGIN